MKDCCGKPIPPGFEAKDADGKLLLSFGHPYRKCGNTPNPLTKEELMANPDWDMDNLTISSITDLSKKEEDEATTPEVNTETPIYQQIKKDPYTYMRPHEVSIKNM